MLLRRLVPLCLSGFAVIKASCACGQWEANPIGFELDFRYSLLPFTNRFIWSVCERVFFGFPVGLLALGLISSLLLLLKLPFLFDYAFSLAVALSIIMGACLTELRNLTFVPVSPASPFFLLLPCLEVWKGGSTLWMGH